MAEGATAGVQSGLSTSIRMWNMTSCGTHQHLSDPNVGTDSVDELSICPKCGSTSFKAKDIDDRTVQISCAVCGWTPPPVRIDNMADREALR